MTGSLRVGLRRFSRPVLEERLLDVGLTLARHLRSFRLARPCRNSPLTTSRGSLRCLTATSSCSALLPPDLGVRPCSAVSSKLATSWTPSVVTPDSQGAFSLLRSCSGWAKVLYSCRTVPPPLQTEGLRQADQDIRHSLGRLVGRPLSDDDWRLASIGVAQGGLGARSALEYAPAAYISSLAQTQELCTRIWPGFGEYDLDGGLMRSDVESSLGASFSSQCGYLPLFWYSIPEEPLCQE